jgi:hypothetical protein
MQAARYGKRSHRRNNRRADIGFHEFKQVLYRSAHKNASESGHWPQFSEAWGTNIAFALMTT